MSTYVAFFLPKSKVTRSKSTYICIRRETHLACIKGYERTDLTLKWLRREMITSSYIGSTMWVFLDLIPRECRQSLEKTYSTQPHGTIKSSFSRNLQMYYPLISKNTCSPRLTMSTVGYRFRPLL